MKSRNEFVQFAGHFQSLAIEISRRLERQEVNVVEAIALAVQVEGTKALDDISAVLVKFVKAVKNVINCDADPFVPNNWSVESHTKGGQFAFDPAKVKFHLSHNQQDGKVIEGSKLRKELTNEPVLNANVLDYLLKNPHLIPENWKKDEKGNARYIFFWGTIYRSSDGYLSVRYLYCRDGRWRWGCGWLGNGWSDGYPAAVFAS